MSWFYRMSPSCLGGIKEWHQQQDWNQSVVTTRFSKGSIGVNSGRTKSGTKDEIKAREIRISTEFKGACRSFSVNTPFPPGSVLVTEWTNLDQTKRFQQLNP